MRWCRDGAHDGIRVVDWSGFQSYMLPYDRKKRGFCCSQSWTISRKLLCFPFQISIITVSVGILISPKVCSFNFMLFSASSLRPWHLASHTHKSCPKWCVHYHTWSNHNTGERSTDIRRKQVRLSSICFHNYILLAAVSPCVGWYLSDLVINNNNRIRFNYRDALKNDTW